MIKIVNKETGKEVLTIKDSGELEVAGTVTESEEKIKEAFEKAEEAGE